MKERRDVAWGFFSNGKLMSYGTREMAAEYHGIVSSYANRVGPIFPIREPKAAARSVESLRIRVLKASLEAAQEMGRRAQRELDAARKSIAPPKPNRRGRSK